MNNHSLVTFTVKTDCFCPQKFLYQYEENKLYSFLERKKAFPIFDSLLCILLSPANEIDFVASRQNDPHPRGVRGASKQKVSELKAKCWIVNTEEKQKRDLNNGFA